DGFANLVSTTRYDAQGHVIESRMPSNPAGGGAGTTLRSYYSGSGSGNCVSAAQAGWPCQSAPASATSFGLPAIPTATTSYDLWGNPTQVVESSGSSQRTTTTVYDSAERACLRSITTGGIGDTSLPAVYTAYDSGTGLVTTTGNL